mmetsp:Transcript_4885/g.5017  ORF Transcript_4885/g.5017 Transcript_4885/m.5017 type:complete len:160 (-) Transcript_4885:184-663(-)
MERTGKWTAEEEIYSSKLIEFFLAGQLESDIQEGDNLRIFLAKKLNCKPMRITKKYGHMRELNKKYEHDKSKKISESIEGLRALDELRENYLSKDIEVQRIRKKRKKYLKGPTIEKKAKLGLCVPDRSEELETDNMTDLPRDTDSTESFDWNMFDFDSL